MTMANSAERKTARPHGHERGIVFTVGPYFFAIVADEVQEICSTGSLAGAAADLHVPEVAKVRHTLRRRNKLYYVVNACAHFRLKPSRPTLVLVLRGSRTAVLVDGVDSMTEFAAVHALPRSFRGEERLWYRGLVRLEDRIVPLVNPASFLSAEESKTVEAARSAELRAARPEGQRGVRA